MRAYATQIIVSRLVLLEAGESTDQDSLVAASERVANKLGSHLSRIIGRDGYRSLLSRALKLTSRRFPSINTVTVADDGSLVGLHYQAMNGSPPNIEQLPVDAATATALLEQIFDLLTTFIGEELTLQIAKTVWPELQIDDAAERETELT